MTPTLLFERAYVGGRWVPLDAHDLLPVINPANGKTIGRVPALDSTEVDAAVTAADDARLAWAVLPPQARQEVLLRWRDGIVAARGALAELLTLEQGKPLTEALGEIDYAAGFVGWYAEEGKRLYGDTIASHLEHARLMVFREPVGVVGLVTPWNFPSAMITRKASAALAAGCPVVLVPSPETPFSALALAHLAERAGLPAGLLSVLTGEPETLVGALCDDTRVRALSFTGSTSVGRQIFARAAPTMKRLVLELGGHAPFIVFPDVDVEQAAQAAVEAKFQTSGQDCLAANRIYVHADIYEAFADCFVTLVQSLRVGPGMEQGVDIGPLIHSRAMNKVAGQVCDALNKGATLLCGGRPHRLGGSFYEATALGRVTIDMQIANEETFGPVAALIEFSDEEELIRAANATEFGLMAYLYTRDIGRVMRLCSRLEYGMVAVNRTRITGPPIPFGGIKQSGLGREGGRYGIEEFTQLKYVCVDVR